MVAGIDGVVRLVVDLGKLVLPGLLRCAAIVAVGVVSLDQGVQREDLAVEVRDALHVGVVLAVVVRVPDRVQSSTPLPRQARGAVG
eukprot:2548039-Heterocapsa_arctica.AAC.1